MDRTFFFWGAVVSGLAVVFGAFGAHAVKGMIPADQLDTYETAARYQMYHGLGLLAVAWAASRWPGSALVRWAGWLMLAGTAIFSGSLYLLSVTGIKILGAITPIGGVGMIAGWALLAWNAIRSKK